MLNQAVLLLSLLGLSQALYFHIGEKERKCFLVSLTVKFLEYSNKFAMFLFMQEELPDDVTVIGE